MNKSILDTMPELRGMADYELRFDRNENDSLEINLNKLNEKATYTLNKKELSFLFPRGSKWRALVGWRSFFCMPIAKDGLEFHVFGIEEIKQYKSQEGHPILHVYFLSDLDKVYKSLRLLNEFLGYNLSEKECIKFQNSIIKVDLSDPNKLARVEEIVLCCAKHLIARKKPIFYRTIILTETHINQFSEKGSHNFQFWFSKKNEIKIVTDNFILGRSDAVPSHFSLKTILEIKKLKKIEV